MEDIFNNVASKTSDIPNNPNAAAQLSNYNPTCHSGSSISLSCPLGGLLTSDQYKWLVKDLAAVNRAVTP